MNTIDKKIGDVMKMHKSRGLELRDAISEIKMIVLKALPDTYDEFGIGKDAQLYISELKKMLQP